MYKLTKENYIVRLADGAFIPADEANTDYQACLAWFSEGNTPEPYVPTPAELNAPILAQLAVIDQKKVRAMTDGILKNDKQRLQQLEDEAEALRLQLV